jgi:hypothetical protein
MSKFQFLKDEPGTKLREKFPQSKIQHKTLNIPNSRREFVAKSFHDLNIPNSQREFVAKSFHDLDMHVDKGVLYADNFFWDASSFRPLLPKKIKGYIIYSKEYLHDKREIIYPEKIVSLKNNITYHNIR